jgi:hypothetical protein
MDGLSRNGSRALVTLLGAALGAALLSGSDQPVTAHSSVHWQPLAGPPLSPRTEALGVRVDHRVMVLGGIDADGTALRDGASYDLRTGRWRHVRIPISLSSRDRAVAAAGLVVLRHARVGRAASWWRYDPRHDEWSRMGSVPPRTSAPSAFAQEVYALSGREVVVYSVQLDRWTPLRSDPIRPALTHRRVTASRAGTVITGYVGTSRVVDRWDGLAWHRSRAPMSPRVRPEPLPARARRSGATFVRVGERLLVVDGTRAWIHTP